MPVTEFQVTVEDHDLTEARAAWMAAESSGAPAARVEELLDDYARLVRARAAQQAERTRQHRQRSARTGHRAP